MVLDLICSQDSQRVLASFFMVAAQSLAEVGENRLNVETTQDRASGGPKKRERCCHDALDRTCYLEVRPERASPERSILVVLFITKST